MAEGKLTKPRIRFRGDRGAAMAYVGAGNRLLFHATQVAGNAGVETYGMGQNLPDGGHVSVRITPTENIIDITPPNVPKSEPLSDISEPIPESPPERQPLRSTSQSWRCPSGLYVQASRAGDAERVRRMFADIFGPTKAISTTVLSYKPLRGTQVDKDDLTGETSLTALTKGKLERVGSDKIYRINDETPWVFKYLGSLPFWYVEDIPPDEGLASKWLGIDATKRLSSLSTKFGSGNRQRLSSPGVAICDRYEYFWAEIGGSQTKIYHTFPFDLSFSSKNINFPITLDDGDELPPAETYELMDISEDGRRLLVLCVERVVMDTTIANSTDIIQPESRGSNYGSGIMAGGIGNPAKLYSGIIQIELVIDPINGYIAQVTILKSGKLINETEIGAVSETTDNANETTQQPMLTIEDDSLQKDMRNYAVDDGHFQTTGSLISDTVQIYMPQIRYASVEDITPPPLDEDGEIPPDVVVIEYYEIDWDARPGSTPADINLDSVSQMHYDRYVFGGRAAEIRTIDRRESYTYMVPAMSIILDPGAPLESAAYTINRVCSVNQILGAYFDAEGGIQYVTLDVAHTASSVGTTKVTKLQGKYRYERRITIPAAETGIQPYQEVRNVHCDFLCEYEYAVTNEQQTTYTHTHPSSTKTWTANSTPVSSTAYIQSWVGLYEDDDESRTVPGEPPGVLNSGPEEGWTAPQSLLFTPPPEIQLYFDGDSWGEIHNDDELTISGDIFDGQTVVMPVNRAHEYGRYRSPIGFASNQVQYVRDGSQWDDQTAVATHGFYVSGTVVPSVRKGRLSLDNAVRAQAQNHRAEVDPLSPSAVGNGTAYAVVHAPPVFCGYARPLHPSVVVSNSLMVVQSMYSFPYGEWMYQRDFPLEPEPPFIKFSSRDESSGGYAKPEQLAVGGSYVEVFDMGFCGPRTNYLEGWATDDIIRIFTEFGAIYPIMVGTRWRSAVSTPTGVKGVTDVRTGVTDAYASLNGDGAIPEDVGFWPEESEDWMFSAEMFGSWNPITDQLVYRCNYPVTWVGHMRDYDATHALGAAIITGDDELPGFVPSIVQFAWLPD